MIEISEGRIYIRNSSKLLIGDPINEIFQGYLKICNPEVFDNMCDYYSTSEKLASDFEKILYQIYPEIYEVLAIRVSNEDTLFQILEEDAYALVIMDGLSLREGVLLNQDLSAEYKVVFKYSFSAIPSDTNFYTQKYFYAESPAILEKMENLPFEFKKVLRCKDVISYTPSKDKVVVWSRIPDKNLHELRESFSMWDLVDIYQDTKKILICILNSLFDIFDKVYVTSDHGYIIDQYIWKGLRDFPSDKRYSNAMSESLKKYCKLINRYWLLIGRYNTIKRGRHGNIRHGGWSFLEVITPFIELEISN
ncbi:MAG: hypothetical protein ACE5KE_01380 [Methanosarcinales archaeon]